MLVFYSIFIVIFGLLGIGGSILISAYISDSKQGNGFKKPTPISIFYICFSLVMFGALISAIINMD